MILSFRNEKIKKVCELCRSIYPADKKKYSKALWKKYNHINWELLGRRVIELEGADNYQELPLYTWKHPLENKWKFKNREWQFAVDLNDWLRIIFKPTGIFTIDDYVTIKAIEIIEINNYH